MCDMRRSGSSILPRPRPGAVEWRGRRGLSMDDTELVSHLIGDVYDAALDPDRWPVVLERMCGFMPGSMAMLFSVDVASKFPRRQLSWGMDPHYFSLYME